MGGGIDGIIEISSILSMKQSSDLEKTQFELRQTFTAVEKFRQELEFLQKGGNPLDLKPRSAATVSLQSTSLIDQHQEQFVTREAKGSFAVTASPHGDSVGSSGRLGTSLEQYSQLTFGQNASQSGDSAALELPKKSYTRRIRSRPNSDGVLTVETTIDRVKFNQGFDSESSGTQNVQTLDVNNENQLPTIEQNLASNEVSCKEDNNLVKEKEFKILNNANSNFDSCHGTHNEDGIKPDVLESTLSVRGPTDILEQSACSQNNNLSTKEHEDYILKEAQIIEEKRKRIAELSITTLPLRSHQNSHWNVVLEEMSWLANDFAQERHWKITLAAQISQQVAFTSQIRYQQQISSWKQKLAAKTLSTAVMEFWHIIEVKSKDLETDFKQGLEGYAMRFLEYNSIHAQISTDQVSAISDMIADADVIDIAWDDNLTEENLFYAVPPGAIEAYRKSIESHFLQLERTWSGMQEEGDASGYDTVADNSFEEDDSKALKATKKKRKKLKFYTAKSYETGPNFPFMQSVEENIGPQPIVLSGKQDDSSLNVSFPTKHVYTASRQRVVGPFSGEAQIPNNMEAESAADYEKRLHFDSIEVSDRPKKKKKFKHPKDYLIRKLDANQLDSHGSNGLYVQHNMKRLKIRQSSDNSFDHFTPMANQKKFMELLSRDPGRKSKNLKMPAGQPGSGSPWSLFEDQFLVVLVHDMGPNWELISDAINSNLQFKSIFRSSKECKQRHKMFMDISTGDGADSAEDLGSFRPYPYTLPGIPEGSARQLFQRLQGPMEENTLRSHFEKIIMIEKKQFFRRKQKDKQEPKQLQQPHSSHTLSLSQVSPNNLNGGPVLTPLELCEAIASSPDVPVVGFQDSHIGPSSLPLGNEFSSASVPLNPSIGGMEYGFPKTGSLLKDDPQRMQQYNQMMSARGPRHSSLSPGSHSGTGRPVGMLPTGNNNIGVMSGMNRGVTTMARPAFHGVASPSMLNPSNIHSQAGPGLGRPILRSRDAMHLMRPNQNNNHQRQIPPVSQSQSSQPQFATNTSHKAFGMRFAKERQQQYATSNGMMPHVQPPNSEFPVSSPQNSRQIKSQNHPLPSPHGPILNPQTNGYHSHQFQQHINNQLVNSSQMSHQKLANNRLLNSSGSHTSKLQISPPQTSSAGASS